MKALEPGMIIKFKEKLDCVDGKIVVDVYHPRMFLGFRMSKFKKEQLTINHLR
jgi:hypothetical protein